MLLSLIHDMRMRNQSATVAYMRRLLPAASKALQLGRLVSHNDNVFNEDLAKVQLQADAL